MPLYPVELERRLKQQDKLDSKRFLKSFFDKVDRLEITDSEIVYQFIDARRKRKSKILGAIKANPEKYRDKKYMEKLLQTILDDFDDTVHLCIITETENNATEL
jgi:hypothetical protein